MAVLAISLISISEKTLFLAFQLGIDRLSTGPIIGTNIQHFDVYRHWPFFFFFFPMTDKRSI